MSNHIVLNESPRVVKIEDFLTEEERDHLILHATPHLKKSEVVDPVSGEGIVNDYRTGMNHCFQRSQDLIIKGIEEKVAKVCGVRLEQLEFLQVCMYSPGDEFKTHQDWLTGSSSGHARQLAMGGQRIITCIIYLKAPEEGGDTYFEALNLKVSPQERAALLWYNVRQHRNEDGDVEPDERVVHCGKPVTKGQKWIVTCWIRERAHDGSEEAAHKVEKAKKVDDKKSLEAKLKELRMKNRKDGHAEIMEVCKRRNLVLVPQPVMSKDGRIGAILDLVDPEYPDED